MQALPSPSSSRTPEVLVASLLPCPTWLLPCHPLLPPSLPPCLAKVGKPSRSKHNALPSGSLQFRALSKEDHGEWECIATNVVTSITASTHLTVIGMGQWAGGWWSGCWRLDVFPKLVHPEPGATMGSLSPLWTPRREVTWGLSWGGLLLVRDRQNVSSNPLTQKLGTYMASSNCSEL